MLASNYHHHYDVHIPVPTLVLDDDTLAQWLQRWEDTTLRLNSNPAIKLFEVGSTGMLCIGDLPLSASCGYDVILPDARPGIWRVAAASPRTHDPDVAVHLAWVAPGPLDVDRLPPAVPKPGADSAARLEQLGVANVESGRLGVVDADMSAAVLDALGGDEARAVELLSSHFAESEELVLRGGFVMNVNDGIYVVSGRRQGTTLVELAIREATADQPEDD